MKLVEMKVMVKCRHNRTGFLHMNDIATLNELFNKHYNVNKQSFNEICEKAFELYKQKAISNETCAQIIELCCKENGLFKTESHRFENDSIYEWSVEQNAYLFLKNGTKKEFESLNNYID